MKTKLLFFIIVSSLTLTACGQTDQSKDQPSSINKTVNNIDLSIITNPIVKSAIEALQANDIKVWYSYFTEDAVFTDDGRTLDLRSFFDNAFEKDEKFLTIDKVENDGKDIYGNFYAGQWGTFNVFFNFTINEEGKITRLDIGQVK